MLSSFCIMWLLFLNGKYSYNVEKSEGSPDQNSKRENAACL